MKNKRGDVMIGLLAGLAIGAMMLYVQSGNEAQNRANITGMEVSMLDVIAEEPGSSVLTVIGPAAGGAAVGWALDEFAGNDEPSNNRNNQVRVNGNEGNVNINISGDSDNDVDTRTDTRNDTRTNQ